MSESRTEKNHDIAKELDKEKNSILKKKIIKISLIVLIPLIVILSIIYFLIRVVGNIGLVVREYAIYKDNIPKEAEGLKIVQFSDLHFNNTSSLNTVKKVVKAINKANPDIVIFTGDLIDSHYEIDSDTIEAIMSELNSINASLGKYAIRGEEDFENFTKVFNNSNFKILENTVEKIYIGSSSIDLLAVDEKYIKENIKGYNEESFTITIVHKPDLADRIIEDFKTSIIFAGHSHNGQIILPFIGPLMKKEGAKKYPLSSYTIGDVNLYVSGGIGNSKHQWRLFNHPSINFYRLRAK